MGKQPKAAQNPSKYDEFLASRSGSHPKWLLTLKHQVSYIITLKTAFQNILPCLNILEFIVFLLKLNCGFPKNKADKTFFSFDLHTFCQKQTFCYPTTFFESPITHKRFIFKDSYIPYGKRQKSCTLIVIYTIWLYLASPIYNSSSKSHRLFYCKGGSNLYLYNSVFIRLF